MQRARKSGRGERGSVLALVVILVLLAGLGAIVALQVSDAAFQRVAGDAKLDKACQIADAGLSYYVEQWRRDPTVLNSSTTYPATTTAQNSNINIARGCGGGTFTAIEIDQVVFVGSGAEGRVLTIRGEYDRVRYTFKALLAPNMSSPIQGVGTTSYQRWYSGATFDSTGAEEGTLFGNTTARFDGVANSISGNAKFVSTITDPNDAVTGLKVTTTAATFPSQGTIITNMIADMATHKNVSGYWQNASTNLLAAAAAGTKPTAMERVSATVSNLDSTVWGSSNTMNMSHWIIKGGNMSLPAGNYAFGRLYLDGTTLTIKAASGGSDLVMPDIYLVNGARLILDTTDGPFRMMTGNNNAYSSSIGTSGAQKYNPSTNTFSSATPSLKMTGDTGIWNISGGAGTNLKRPGGTGSGYDDWLIKGNSILATVTSDPASKGIELYMKAESDLVLNSGGAIIGGIQSSDLATLKNSSTSYSTINSMGNNSMGFLVWNAGGASLPRFNMSAGAGEGTTSRFVGLTYGGFEGTVGAGASFTGAYVGKQIDMSGEFHYDSRLMQLVSSADANTQHVVVRQRVQ